MNKTYHKAVLIGVSAISFYFLLTITRALLKYPELPIEVKIALPCVWMAFIGMLLMFFYLPYKRRKDLEGLSLTAGLDFDPEAAGLPPLERTGLELFLRGHSRQAENLLRVPLAGDLCFFDYAYSTGSGKHQQRHLFTIALFRLEKADLPAFELRPETMMDKLGELIGFKDIDIEGFPEFSRKYKLTGKDTDAILRFFDAQRVSYLERNLGWGMAGAGQYLALYRGDQLQKPQQYQLFMMDARTLFSALFGR